MSKVCRPIAWSALTVALSATFTMGAAAQETDPQVEDAVVQVPAQVVEPQVPVVVALAAVGGGEGGGEATLSASAGEQTEAVVEVEGLAPGTEWSAFLIAGTCEEPGDAITPLGTIEVTDGGSGRGEAAVTAALAELTSGAATVQVHPQGETPTQAILCGALPAGAAGPRLPAM